MTKQETPEEFNHENYLETRDFQLKFQNIFYNILIGKTSNKIIIRTLHFSLDMNIDDFCQLTSMKFNSLNDIYSFIINSFDNNKVLITGINESEMNLLFIVQKFGLTLEFHARNIDHIINNLWNKIIILEQKLNNITEENIKLKDENIKLRNQINGNNMNNFNNINNLNDMNLNNINDMNMNNFNNMNNMNNMINNINNMNININNNNFNNDFNNDINNNLNQIKENGFSIIVKESGSIKMRTLENCQPNDKISDLMKRYRNKINDYTSKLYFTYNAKQLNPNKTLSEEGLINLAKIIVMKGKPPLNYQS
jgi:hypothetical protein